MKNHMKITALIAFLAVSLTAFGFTTIGSQNFTLQNNSTENLGVVTINLQNGPAAYLPVPGQGTFSMQLPSNEVSIVVNGVTVPVGMSMLVKLNDGKAVNVNNVSASPIIDPNEVN